MLTTISVCTQINGYQFIASSGESLFDMSSGTTILIGAGVDNGVSSVTNIGFTFNYGCSTSYTQFSVNSNGLMRLGSTVILSTSSNSLGSVLNNPKIAVFWDDLATGTLSSGSKVHYKLFGTSPNRYLVVEWLVVNSSNITLDYNSTFQAVLYETTNDIKLIYGQIPNSSSYSIGITSSTTDYLSVSTNTNTVESNFIDNSNISSISLGKSYTFKSNITGSEIYSSSNVMTASTDSVSICSKSQTILALKIELNSCFGSKELTRISINMNGSTDPQNDVSKIHIYYTASSPNYLGLNSFDGVGTNVSLGVIDITGSIYLGGGIHYFWVVCDIDAGATIGNKVDAECLLFTLGGVDYTPTIAAPSGNRTIVDCPNLLIADYSLISDLSDGTGTYGNGTLSSGSGPTTTGVCFTGAYPGSVFNTPNIVDLEENDFLLKIEFSVNVIGSLNPIIVGSNASRWIGLEVNPSGYLALRYNNNNILTTKKSINASQYYKADLIYSNGNVQLYIDEVLIYEKVDGTVIFNSANDYDFYTSNYSLGKALNGCIRNFQIYNYSDFTNANIVLPMTYLDSRINCNNDYKSIEWSMHNEDFIDKYKILKSVDGLVFFEIGNMKANQKEYKFIDRNFTNNIEYYQLTQISKNGESKVLFIESSICDFESIQIETINWKDQFVEIKVITHEKIMHRIDVKNSVGKLINFIEWVPDKNFTILKFPKIDDELIFISLFNQNEFICKKYFNVKY